MAIIKFEDGTQVNFDGNPTQQDVEEVAQKLHVQGLMKPAAPTPTTGGGFLQGLSNFVGTTGLARGAATALAPDQTGDINRISESAGKFTKMADMLPANDPRRAKLLGLAKETSGQAQALSGENIASIPTNKEVLGSAAQTGLSLATLGGLGTGGGLGAQVLKGGAIGAGFGAAGALEANRTPTLGDIGTGAVVGGAIPLAGAGISKLKSLITKSLPKSLVNTYLPSTKDLSQHVLENTKLGTTKVMLENSKNNVKSLSKQIDGILEGQFVSATTNTEATKVGQAINKTKLLKNVAQSFGQTGGGGTITSNEVMKNILKVAPQVKGLISKENLTLPEANHLRQAIDQSLGDRFFLAKHSPFTKEVAGEFNSFLRETVKGLAPKTVPIFNELAKEISVRNALNQYTKKMGRITLTDLITAVGGLATVSPLGLVKGAVATGGLIAGERAARSPAVGVGVAKGLSKLGNVALPKVVRQATKLGVLRGATVGSQ